MLRDLLRRCRPGRIDIEKTRAAAPPAARRVVTGFDANGASIVISDGPPPNVLSPLPGLIFSQMWSTSAMPVPILTDRDPSPDIFGIEPPPFGSVIRVLDFPPESEEEKDPEAVRKSFETLGAAHNAVEMDAKPHPNMHKTSTLDYGIIIWGEITLLLEKEEVTLHAGDICIQRGTIHGWVNRGSISTRVVFVLLDGTFERDAPVR